MERANEYFLGCKIDFEKLTEYGFRLEDGIYRYEKELEDNLLLKIEMTLSEDVNFVVIDKEFNDECVNFKVLSYVKSQWLAVFEEIKEKCCKVLKYKTAQACEIDGYIKKTYGVDAEFMWDDAPEFGVYRNGKNKKWFALIMDVDYSVVDKRRKGKVCIINLKSDKVNDLLSEKGFYPAYHMNKKYWITAVLDGTVDFSTVKKVVSESYELIDKKK